MSATNGGRGKPPELPAGHGPAPQEVSIPILKEVTWASQEASAKTESGRSQVSFLVVEGGGPVRHTYIVEDDDKKRILEDLSGGLVMP